MCCGATEASFGGEELYPDLASKAAALGHSLMQNHPFVDGNKRNGPLCLSEVVNQ
ncbi:MAG: Fic family protein [Pyrinomonadaceae bacterium]